MSVLSLRYIEAHTLNGKRLFRGKEEVGFIRNEDFERFKKNRDVEPSIQLHPSQFSISEPLDVAQSVRDVGRAARDVTQSVEDVGQTAKNVTDAINEFNEALKNSTWKEVNDDD